MIYVCDMFEAVLKEEDSIDSASKAFLSVLDVFRVMHCPYCPVFYLVAASAAFEAPQLCEEDHSQTQVYRTAIRNPPMNLSSE
jgi:hypothetical protein